MSTRALVCMASGLTLILLIMLPTAATMAQELLPRLPFETIPDEEIKLNAGIAPRGAPDTSVQSFSLPDGRICILHLEGFLLRALLSSDTGLTFEDTIAVSGKPGSPDVFAYTAISDSKGGLYIAMQVADPLGDRGLFFTSSLDFGRTWNEAVRLLPWEHAANILQTNNAEHKLRMAVSENIVTVVASARIGGYWVTTSTDSGSTWTEPVRIDQPEAMYYWNEDVDIVISPLDSSIHVAFAQYRHLDWGEQPVQSLWLTRSLDGGETFEPELHVGEIVPETSEVLRLDLAVTAQGRLLLGFIGSQPSGYDYMEIVLASGDSGSSYEIAFSRLLTGYYSLDWTTPYIAVDSDSSSILALFSHGANDGLWVTRSLDGGNTFGTSQILGYADFGYARTMSAILVAGNWLVAWPARIYLSYDHYLMVRRTEESGTVWSAPDMASSEESDAQLFTLIQAGETDVLAVFPDQRAIPEGSISDLYASRSSAASLDFSPELRIDDDFRQIEAPVSKYDGVTLASDGANHLYAAFITFGTTAGDLMVASSSDMGRTFSTERVSQRLSNPQVAATPDGYVWIAGVSGSTVVIYRSTDFGGTWTDVSPSLPEYSRAKLGSPRLAALPGGKAYLIWMDDYYNDRKKIMLARNSGGGGGFEVITLDESIGSYGRPRLCAGGETIVTLWNTLSWPDPAQLKTSTSIDAGLSFQDPEVLVDGHSYYADRQVSCDAGSTATVAWFDYDPISTLYTVTTRRFDGEIWRPAVDAAKQDGFVSWELDVAHLDDAGRHVLVTTRVQDRVLASLSLDSGDSYPVQQWLDDDAPVPEALSAYPRITTDGRGNVWVVWIDGSASEQFSIAVRQSTDFGETWGAVRRADTVEPQGSYYNIFNNYGNSWSRNAAALPGIGFIGWTGHRDSTYSDALLSLVRTNQPPVALCRDITVDANGACRGNVTAEDVNDGSYDPDGDPITLDLDPARPFPAGETTVTLIVTDDNGASDTCTATVTVVDHTPPSLSVSLTPDTLWPPNHRMIDVEAAVIANDNCGTPAVILVSIVSSEPDNAPGGGDGNTVNDIQGADLGTADYEFSLRAERSGLGDGRVYTATYVATDSSGNETTAAAMVEVPFDQEGETEPLGITAQDNSVGTVLYWNLIEGASHYNVIRGNLLNIAESESSIDLGPVVCIEVHSLDQTTEGWDDTNTPASGEMFLYLVEYDNGTRSSYGTASASKPRVVQSGDCE